MKVLTAVLNNGSGKQRKESSFRTVAACLYTLLSSQTTELQMFMFFITHLKENHDQFIKCKLPTQALHFKVFFFRLSSKFSLINCLATHFSKPLSKVFCYLGYFAINIQYNATVVVFIFISAC